jgi:hypothetical protein
MHPTRWVASVALAVIVAGGALAQGRPGFGIGVFGSPAFLLVRPEVQTDLKLSEDQKKSVMEMLQKLRADNQGLGDKLQGASQEERQKILADFRASQMKAVNAILDEHQQKRLREITLQQNGVIAWTTDPQVAEALKLTGEQKTQLSDLLMKQAQGIREAFQGGAGQEAFEKVSAIRKETNEKAAALLTDEQKAKWKAMLGAELKLAPFRPAGNN